VPIEEVDSRTGFGVRGGETQEEIVGIQEGFEAEFVEITELEDVVHEDSEVFVQVFYAEFRLDDPLKIINNCFN